MSDDEYGDGYDNYNEDNYGDRERVGGDEKKVGDTNFSDRIRGSDIDKFKERITVAYNNLIQSGFEEIENLDEILRLAEREIQPEYRHAGTFLLAGALYTRKEDKEFFKNDIFSLIEHNEKNNYENRNIPSKEDLFRYYKLFD
jgi:hypothetical protein